MFLFRKNIILVPSDYDGISNVKGLVSLDCYDTKVVCNLKTYNLQIQKPLLLGVAINNKVNKIEVDESNVKNMQFQINSTIKNNDDISCVLLNIFGTDYKIVLWGSTQINKGWKTSLQTILDEVETEATKEKNIQFKTNNICELQENICDTQSKQENYIQEKSFNDNLCLNNFDDKEILSSNNFDNEQLSLNDFDLDAKNINQTEQTNNEEQNFDFEKENNKLEKYENLDEFKGLKRDEDKTEIYSYKEQELNDFIDKVIDMTEDNKQDSVKRNIDDMSFYERINPQIEKMFKNNKEEVILNEILPNSKFCRVEFEDGSGYYVFGIIYDDGLPKYLCYGLPAKKDSQPPQELSNLYQWLPIDASDDTGDGYYMMYQDAISGKNIELEII